MPGYANTSKRSTYFVDEKGSHRVDRVHAKRNPVVLLTSSEPNTNTLKGFGHPSRAHHTL
jgi:hypothetical protein